ncbi:hypothetical protein BWR59_29880 [Pseudomonas sp. Bc-h]|jgi:hypothetical protein|uniref:hypothetical protein n=1 Tax=Pseudomonas sp. Bc-h TaxID=1943632 RepID=UPI0009DA3C42|nr:hypothetical protein [Pseudomonas sp. Bc-h]OQR26668.1 hypothetical protein BWR59_29880 [Pseudomonas sp. Bc-h]
MAVSEKPIVIERIFDTLYDKEAQTFTRTLVTAEDVQEAKRYCAEHYGIKMKLDSNPFNFMKDIVRGRGASKMWPQRLKDLQIGGVQRTGDGAIFEFVHGIEGALDSLDEDFTPSDSTPSFAVQSLSLPLASKALGRTDESWLLQVAVNLRIIESHFASASNSQIDALELTHLQMDIKLRKVQIDALFRALHAAPDGKQSEVLITVEAKQGNQRILTEQIGRQVIAAFKSTETDLVIPVAIAAIRNKGIYVVEFAAVTRETLDQFSVPTFHRDAMFVLQPKVKGI